MKSLALFLPDGVTPAPATDFGSVPPGSTTPGRQLLLKNTGDEPISNLGGLIEQTSLADGQYRVTVGSTNLTAIEQALAPVFEVGASLAVSESWSTPANVTMTGPDTATLVFLYDQ